MLTNRLIQEGPRNARIVLVGEAPGATEDATGRPFVGGAGELLNRCLERSNISRSECFLTNICHVRPPENKFEWFVREANRGVLGRGLLQLRSDLSEIRPNVVVALGGWPLEFLTGKAGITKWRGSILPSTLVSTLKVIAAYHPAGVLRNYDWKPVLELDLRRVRRESEFPELRRPERQFFLDPDGTTRQTLGAEMREAEWLAIDIECFMRGDGRWELACVGFSDKASRAMVIPVRNAIDREYVRWLCGGPTRKVLQNGTFDALVLKQAGIEIENFAWDTMLAQHALFPECAGAGDEMTELTGAKRKIGGLAKGLGFLTSIYTDEPYYKDDGKVWKETGDLQMFWRYNALDAAVTREIRDRQEEDLRATDTVCVFDRRMSLVQPLMGATIRGIKVDLAARDALKLEVEAELNAFQESLDTGAGAPINVKSTSKGGDIQRLLYDQLALPVKRKRGTGAITADKQTIVDLAEKHGHPLLLTILAIRERRDILERYLATKLDADDRMRCSFDIAGTNTGRLSSRASIFGSGTNLQNQPHRVRRIFIPDSGKVFVYRDFSQAEARIVAYLAEEQGLIDLFNDPTRDVHRENAARLFEKEVSAITKEERYLAKRLIHASNYGMEADKFVSTVNKDSVDTWGRKGTGITIDLPRARRLLQAYHMLYPGIRERFWKEIERELRATLTLTTPLGMRRQFFGRWDQKFLMEAYAYIPQSTIGELCNIALCNVANNVHSAELLLAVHDSILVQCSPDDVQRVAADMANAMDIEMQVKGMAVRIPTDCQVGWNWGDKDEENPQGLRPLEAWNADNR